MKRSNIAAQLYTLRDFCKNETDLAQTLKRVRSIGYEAVQVSGIGPIAPETVKQLADDAGLAICATHVSFESLVNDFEENVRKHKLWNCSYVGIGGLPEAYRTSGASYAEFAREASDIGRRLQEHGLQFIYHNHEFEFQKFDGKTGMAILAAEGHPAHFGFELDVYWVQVGGANPVDMIRAVDGRMRVIHLKDLEVIGRQQHYAEIGQGNLNFEAIVAACRDTGVEWYVVEQDECRRDPFESLAISFDYLSKLATD
jgi:sugar phosphate isomerase/epimerase